MNGLKRALGGLNRGWMVRAWVIAAVFYGLMIFISLQGEKPLAERAAVMGYFGLCTLLFPLSKLVWDQLKGFVLGDSFLILPVIFLWPAKLVVNLFLFAFAVFVAPFGLAYLWFATKEG